MFKIILYIILAITAIIFLTYLIIKNMDNMKREAAKVVEEKARQNAKNLKFNNWHNKLTSCYNNIERHILYGE